MFSEVPCLWKMESRSHMSLLIVQENVPICFTAALKKCPDIYLLSEYLSLSETENKNNCTSTSKMRGQTATAACEPLLYTMSKLWQIILSLWHFLCCIWSMWHWYQWREKNISHLECNCSMPSCYLCLFTANCWHIIFQLKYHKPLSVVTIHYQSITCMSHALEWSKPTSYF